MKKIFTLFAATLMAVGANAQKEDLLLATGWNTETAPSAGLTYNVSQWAEVGFTLETPVALSDCKSITAVFTKSFEGAAVGWKLYDEDGKDFYPANLVSGEKEQVVDLSAGVVKKDADTDEVTATMSTLSKVSLMPSEEPTLIQIDKFILEKTDGSKVEYICEANSNWGIGALVGPGGTITFKGQYGTVELVNDAVEHLAYDTTAEEYYEYTIEFAEPLTQTVFVEYDDAEQAGFKYANAKVGDTKIEFTVNGDLTKNVGYIYLKADATGGYPFDVKIAGVSRVKIIPEATISTALWEGEVDFGNWAEGQGVNVSADKFASVNAGDVIEYVYTVTPNDSQDWYQFKTIFSGTEDALTSVPDLNEYDCATVSKTSTSFKFTLNEADAARLKETGLYVNGKDIVITKVNVIQLATGIQAVKAQKQSTQRYNLAGQKVGSDYRGVVIENGRKLVVR